MDSKPQSSEKSAVVLAEKILQDIIEYTKGVDMQSGRPSTIVNNSVDQRMAQLRIQIAILEEQLAASKRDLKNLEIQRRNQDG